jgi:glycosyltransferase involved in cell wall biosynthesis
MGYMDIWQEIERRFALQEEYLGPDKPVNRRLPLVSVIVLAYRHAGYIGACLDGILKQRTDFDFEIIIGEDGSTDGTREICVEYAGRHPDKIRLFLRDRRLSIGRDDSGDPIIFNGIWANFAARGRYVAKCDGDDYWTDPDKLAKQVAFLEKHPDFGLVCTNYRRFHQRTGTFLKNRHGRGRVAPSGAVYAALLEWNFIGVSTIVADRRRLEECRLRLRPIWFSTIIQDYLIWLDLSRWTKIKYLPDVTTVYRVLNESANNSADPLRLLRNEKQMADLVAASAARYVTSARKRRAIDRRWRRQLVYSSLRKGVPYAANEVLREAPARLPADRFWATTWYRRGIWPGPLMILLKLESTGRSAFRRLVYRLGSG